MQHRTKRHDATMIGCRILVIVRTFLHIVAEHICRRNICLIHLDAVTIHFVEDALTIEHILEVHAIALLEILHTIQLIVVCRNLASVEQLEEQGEEVHLSTLWLYRIVKRSVLIFCEVDGTVDVTTPTGIFGHIYSSREHKACTIRAHSC